MGQAASHLDSVTPSWLKNGFQKVHIEIQRDASLLKKEILFVKDVALIDFPALQETISNLNMILKLCCQESTEKVLFGLKTPDNETVYWKTAVRIICFKVDLNTKSSIATRIMNIHQFWRLRHDLLGEVYDKRILNELDNGFEFVPENINEHEVLPEQPLGASCTLTVSSVLERVDRCVNDTNETIEECSICMDKKCDISLSCAHSFCQSCINQWSIANQTCPICRDEIATHQEFWEFTQMPNQEDLNKHLVALALGDT